MPLPADIDYRQFQDAVVPGIAGLHRSMQAILDSALVAEANVLIVGAGGGREIETIGASPRRYQMVGVDASPEMLAQARRCVDSAGLADRTELVRGDVSDLSNDLHHAATALFVMHFLPDDGSKASFLYQIRRRLHTGGTYLHVDVCFDGREHYERGAAAYVAQAQLGGLSADGAQRVAKAVADMPIIPETTLLDRFQQAGFAALTPFFRGLWYTGWWAEAA
jgi:tRNA (cmo5U34)-methyltransferase